MKNQRVATRYARSLLKLAEEMKVGEKVIADMDFIAATINANRDLRLLLKSPIIREDKKIKILTVLFKSNVAEITLSFIKILAKKRREEFLVSIADEYKTQYKDLNRIVTATVITAVSLTEETKNHILEKIKTMCPGEKIELIIRIDPSILGGFLLKVGDRQYDGTIIFKLNQLKKQFKENPFIGEYLLN